MPEIEVEITLEVNGKQEQVSVEPGRTLLYLLRDNLGLTGTKDGCRSGDCGACVVILDGRSVNSCMVLAPQTEGSSVMTVEGLAKDSELHPLQRAFAENWAFQCGFCTPGMLISCYALLESNTNPTRDEIRAAISGNFCRCTGYQAVIKAVEQAAAELRALNGGSDNG
ncbi:MAG: (2Fe-2S)-binding protein [Gammaproteobacteria bacterium]|nr:(2Fe-2S)-binding protein [Gammaproteobacteria bacterium]